MLREERLNHYIERTLRHSHDVANLLFIISKHLDELSFKVDRYELLKRAVSHDIDKFSKDFLEAIVDSFYLKDQVTQERVEEAEKIVDKHYIYNTHHLKYHVDNNIPLSNEDICEMACDWISSARKDDINLVENASIWKAGFDNHSNEVLFLKEYREHFF
jgi:hypothetical protein